jgi:hypothetical protein
VKISGIDLKTKNSKKSNQAEAGSVAAGVMFLRKGY